MTAALADLANLAAVLCTTARSIKSGVHRASAAIKQDVVVIGAGPVGLLSALDAAMALAGTTTAAQPRTAPAFLPHHPLPCHPLDRAANGARPGNLPLSVWEKRRSYKRNVWFDLDVSTQAALHRLGLRELREPLLRHESSKDIVSIRCQALERWLATVQLG